MATIKRIPSASTVEPSASRAEPSSGSRPLNEALGSRRGSSWLRETESEHNRWIPEKIQVGPGPMSPVQTAVRSGAVV